MCFCNSVNRLNSKPGRTIEVVNNTRVSSPPQQIVVTARQIEGVASPQAQWHR
ncbi:hypothetical protein [Paenibacillus dendritiformis]|uniref:hypothetical protein n=1 Tax=Paenibacillus dendritiformis TaxID=130049 RepID=UPI0018CE846A|nr:hypothetical protein [Paenibacillus dendritiformis]